ncbi:hypothetical protein EDC47_10642 [Raoultella planticola]|nr:hypothetical protein EDC47_10642 [Raoultella planticola]
MGKRSPRLLCRYVGVNEEIIRCYVRHQEKTEQTHEQQMELLE